MRVLATAEPPTAVMAWVPSDSARNPSRKPPKSQAPRVSRPLRVLSVESTQEHWNWATSRTVVVLDVRWSIRRLSWSQPQKTISPGKPVVELVPNANERVVEQAPPLPMLTPSWEETEPEPITHWE